ncbi:hypothetical protein [Novacetimonas hansenii]|uniref:Uncharacterized protein n=1 Tax=Novacetimonas hansenii TaxID=436 RepID=A0ABQ0SH77_NOVHA|nr:hypothetical protein [Novacetimonas hansenii]GAN84043.1 hypothetical protein Gaha_0122_043 [Novacetimonas hansenii JCM 7643]GBQ55858.1 hypothetical protein AA0243_1031 [Novacetimonas hansenii NRIC 0243]GEC64623.1 hypothetical protein GHA01_24720 [Novacetimonas hansenii]
MIVKIEEKINDKLDVGTVKEFPKLVAEKLVKEGKATIIKADGSDMVTKDVN